MIGAFTRRRGVRAGERFGRICLPGLVVPGNRLPAYTGLGFNAAIAPAEGEERENLLFLRHLQVIGHRDPDGENHQDRPRSLALKWPLFRRSVVAAFQRSLTPRPFARR